MDVYFQLFREVVGEREPELAGDDPTPTKEKLKDKGKEPFFKKEPRTTIKEVFGAAGSAEVQDAKAKLLVASVVLCRMHSSVEGTWRAFSLFVLIACLI